jgi:predicted  nucleic acid-binding Zn-ribbon protein
MIELLQTLLKLQALEFEEVEAKVSEATIAALRAKVPPQVLGHYDRLVARGKKGVAMVRGQVCTGCHMRLPIGTIMTLKHDEDIQLCESCGRYLYLAPEAETETAEPAESAPAPKAAKKTRKPKKSSLPA